MRTLDRFSSRTARTSNPPITPGIFPARSTARSTNDAEPSGLPLRACSHSRSQRHFSPSVSCRFQAHIRHRIEQARLQGLDPGTARIVRWERADERVHRHQRGQPSFSKAPPSPRGVCLRRSKWTGSPRSAGPALPPQHATVLGGLPPICSVTVRTLAP